MNDLDARNLAETFQERTEALPPADFTPDRLMRAAQRQHRRHRAYGALGGVAAAALVVTLALQSDQLTTAPPVPAATSNPLETALTVDQVVRANASHAWAVSLPAGPPEQRDLGYQVVRRGDRVGVVLDRGEALLPEGVRAVSRPTKAADGWLFIGHRADLTGERGVDLVGSVVLHVSDDLTVRTVTEADAVASILPSPDGRGLAVVTGRRSGDAIEYDGRRFFLASGETVDVPFPNPEAASIATWDGDLVTFVGRDGSGTSTVHVYDLSRRRWTAVPLPGASARDTTVALAAAPAAHGAPTNLALVVLHGLDESCLHRMTKSSVLAEPLVCGSSELGLVARVSPGGRYAVVGQGWNGRVNTGPAARVIDLATGRDVAGIPRQLLDVGANFLIWEDDHTLIGQATRATPVHDAATQFRWDLATSSGQSLGWDPTQGPMPVTVSPEAAVLLWPWGA